MTRGIAIICGVLALSGCGRSVSPPPAIDSPPAPTSSIEEVRNTERELVALVLAGEDEVGVIRSSLEERAEVDWRELSSGEAYEGVLSAFEEAPELIVVVGPGLLPEVDIISASYLDQEVVLLGGQIAEPTENVTAILWPGADDRAALAGSELSFEGGDRWGERAVQVALDPASSGREVITLTDSGLG